MVLSAAEKQRRYRQKRDSDPIRRAEYLAKSIQKYQSDKSVGKRKSINEMTQRDQRMARKQWRQQQLNHRRKIKEENHILTPPNSPIEQEGNLNAEIPIPEPSRQMQSGRKKHKQKTNKCYRDQAKLKRQVEMLSKRASMYKQRWIRERHKVGDTPRTKTRNLLRNFSASQSKAAVRKTLIFNNVLVDEMGKSYQRGSHKVKRSISSIIAGHLIKKYHLLKFAKENIGIAKSHGSRKRKGCLRTRIGKQIREFFERDDVSKMTPGMKQTVTRLKIKKQKRILVDNMHNLHKKFLEEQQHTKISYTSFCRLRPFWIVSPTEKDRDTCACKLHENMSLLVQSLYSMKLIPSNDTKELVSLSVCDVEDKDCMYNECIICGDRNIVKQECDQNEDVVWTEWRTRKENRSLKSEKKRNYYNGERRN